MSRRLAPSDAEVASGTVTAPLAHRPASSSPGADINTQASDSASALYEACKNEHEPVVEFLLSQGADANKANKDGMLPLHVASKKGNYRSAQAPSPPPDAHWGGRGGRVRMSHPQEEKGPGQGGAHLWETKEKD